MLRGCASSSSKVAWRPNLGAQHASQYPVLLTTSRHVRLQSSSVETAPGEASTSRRPGNAPIAIKGPQATARIDSTSLRKRLRRLTNRVYSDSKGSESRSKQASTSFPSKQKAIVNESRRGSEKHSAESLLQAKSSPSPAWKGRTSIQRGVSFSIAERNNQRIRPNTTEGRNQDGNPGSVEIKEADGSLVAGKAGVEDSTTQREEGREDAGRSLDTQGWGSISQSEQQSFPTRDPPPHQSLTEKDEDGEERVGDDHGVVGIKSIASRSDANGAEVKSELIKGASKKRYRRIKPTEKSVPSKITTPANYLPFEQTPIYGEERRNWWDAEGKWSCTVGGQLSANQVGIEKVEPLRVMEVPQLAHGLDRVLFNPGVHWLRDARSGIYNFEPQLRDICDVDLFDYSALPPYLTSSVDPELAELVRRTTKKYSGSTSSMTSMLSQIYFLISAWKQPNLSGFSAGFAKLPKTFSFGAKLPATIILRRFEDELANGDKHVRYAIDADKSVEGSENNNYVLTQLGKSVEKLLTTSPEQYNKYLRVNSDQLDPAEKSKKEAYHYAATDKLLMRSQLDCSDERLPRKTFDLKTRAVVAVRQDRANWVESSGYLIRQATGIFESFEREMWDMTRAALLKYFFQARIGHMDGIMVAYHSTATMFGFQYLPCEDMALKLFGSVEMGEQAFRLSVGLLERILDAVTDLNASQSLKIVLDTEQGVNPKMLAFVQAISEDGRIMSIGAPRSQSADSEEKTPTPGLNPDQVAQDGEKSEQEGPTSASVRKLLQLDISVDRYLGEDLVRGPVDFDLPSGYKIQSAMEDEISRRKRATLPPLDWSVEYCITPRSDLSVETAESNLKKVMSRKEGLAPLILPNLDALNERERLRELELSKNEAALQKFFEDRKSGAAMGMPVAPGQIVLGEHVRTVATNDGDATAACADMQEEMNKAATSTQAWKKQSSAIERLRELARLGKKDKDRDALTDLMQIYERRGD